MTKGILEYVNVVYSYYLIKNSPNIKYITVLDVKDNYNGLYVQTNSAPMCYTRYKMQK